MEEKKNMSVYELIEMIINVEEYRNAKVIVIDENLECIVNEKLTHILFFTMLKLKEYEFKKWCVDDAHEIHAIIITSRKY